MTRRDLQRALDGDGGRAIRTGEEATRGSRGRAGPASISQSLAEARSPPHSVKVPNQGHGR